MFLITNPCRRHKSRRCTHPSRHGALLVVASSVSSSPFAIAVPAGHPWRKCMAEWQRSDEKRLQSGLVQPSESELNRKATQPIRPNFASANPNRLCREQGHDSIKQKSCHKKLATSSKIPSIGLGSFSHQVNARDDFGCEKNGDCNCENE
ncbi:hypothetical protein PIB30_050966 [Stylosanthes scabra]|uniref:Uncharacterized protein n=1 Tax=Stylosanthes scabra TaxID=79078 RepID=A0ABU6YJK0_9FABA|nr:hypothetical protein [Stylosanthes scabra]